MSTDGTRVEVHLGRFAVVDFDPQLTFEVVEECTWCCHHGVLLYERDLLELASRECLTKLCPVRLRRTCNVSRSENDGPVGDRTSRS